MKEEELKKIISKSTIETSDNFIDEIISRVEENTKCKEAYHFWSFRYVLYTCLVLVFVITFFLFRILNDTNGSLRFIADVVKTPIFLLVTITCLYYINNIIKLNENLSNSKKI